MAENRGDEIKNFTGIGKVDGGNVTQIINQPSPEKESKPPFSIPLRTAKFVGRTEDLKTLHQELQEKEKVAITAVTGMGGIGKTELAIQYAHQYRKKNTYPGGICWLNVRDKDLPAQIIGLGITYLKLDIPKEADLATQVQYCWSNWFSGEVLLILDDVINFKNIRPYLPTENRFKVLVTTRQQGLTAGFTNLELQVLTETAALELLKYLVGKKRIDRERETAQGICEWLGYLPLGIELVGRYLKGKQDLSLGKMQQRLQEKKLSQKALTTTPGDMTAERGVRAAFELTWQELNESAQEVACLLSVFAVAPFDWGLVEQCLPDEDEEELEDIRDEVLLEASLLQRKGEGSYELHSLIHQFLREKLAGLEGCTRLKENFCKVMVAVAEEIPDTLTLEDIAKFKDGIPHLGEVVESWIEFVEDEDLLWPFLGMARFYEGQGTYQQALPYYKQCLEQTKARLGDDHPDVATSLNNLAGLYKNQGRYEEAEPLSQRALNLRKRLLGDDHPDVATSLNNLALLYKNQGRYEEAEPLYQRALNLRKKLLGDDHPYVAQSLNNLAGLYKNQGKYEEAEPLYQRALNLRKKLLGDDHPDVATSLNNLAALYDNQGRYEEAEPLYQRALDLSKKLLGDDHPDVATSLNNLASLYNNQGRYEEAEPLYQRALDLRKKLLGDEHPDVADSLNNLALFYNNQGRYEEAEPLSQRALNLRKKLLGDDHPYVAQSLNNLAVLYDNQGKYEEAEPLFQGALNLRKKLLGDDHPDVATSLNNLAVLYDNQGKYEEAEPLFQGALELCERVLGSNHPNTVVIRDNLASLREKMGK